MEPRSESSHKPTDTVHLTLEAWPQGLVVGALLPMILVTISNMRKGSLLHKLILLELVVALPDGFYIFSDGPTFGWVCSSTSTLMIISWTLHNVVAWMKNKPFLSRPWSLAYIGTVVLAQGYWVLESYANFAYFNNINERLFPITRPFEAVFRDPWRIFTIISLVWNIKYRYDSKILELVKVSHRFRIMLLSMALSIVFIIVNILSVTPVLHLGGLNPFWRMAFIFKCFTDTIILDDFKTCLDKLSAHKRALLQNELHGIRSDPSSKSRAGRRSTIRLDQGAGAADKAEDLHMHTQAIHVETRVEVAEAAESPSVAPSPSSTSDLVNTDEGAARGPCYNAHCWV